MYERCCSSDFFSDVCSTGCTLPDKEDEDGIVITLTFLPKNRQTDLSDIKSSTRKIDCACPNKDTTLTAKKTSGRFSSVSDDLKNILRVHPDIPPDRGLQTAYDLVDAIVVKGHHLIISYPTPCERFKDTFYTLKGGDK